MIDEKLGFLIYTFTTILVVVSPISGVVTFISLTSEMTNEKKNEIAKKSVTIACFIAKVSRGSITEEEISQSQEREDIWIFPIGLPLLTGPGTISTVIVLMGGAQNIEQKIMVIASIILTFVVCSCVFLFSRSIHKLIGYNGMLVFTRLMGLLLAALAVHLTATGIINIFKITV